MEGYRDILLLFYSSLYLFECLKYSIIKGKEDMGISSGFKTMLNYMQIIIAILLINNSIVHHWVNG